MLKIIAIAALTLTATPVIAAPATSDASGEVEITVTARDLSGAAGQRRLMQRVSAAAEQICGSYATVESFQVDDITICRGQVFSSAKQQLAVMDAKGKLRLAAR